MSILIIWTLVALCGLWVHNSLCRWKYKDALDIFILCLLYFFASPVIHVAIWIFEDKPNWNSQSIVSLLTYIILCLLLLKNIL